ncbi:MAG: VWA domain-containing protein [Spirochaetia bacterium]|nr:VWA domain-containing protein [Spirochaetia bacterium]
MKKNIQTEPLNPAEIEEMLDVFLEAEFNFRDTTLPVSEISVQPREQQDYILQWVQRMSSSHVELGYQFVRRVVSILGDNDRRVMEAWARHALDAYDEIGLRPALEILSDVDNLKKFFNEGGGGAGAVLQDVLGILQPFAHGLSGRKLKIAEAHEAYTDTETIYLPAFVARLPESENNFLLYKSMVAFCWAQTRFGTFRMRISAHLDDLPEGFLDLFFAMETLRLEACIRRELPGLFRDIQRIKSLLGEDTLPPEWTAISEKLSSHEITAEDVMEFAKQNSGTLTPYPPFFFSGKIEPELAEACIDARLAREKKEFAQILRKIRDDLFKDREPEDPKKEKGIFEAKKIQDLSVPEGFKIEITIDDLPVSVPEDARAVANSIVQDLGYIPEDYLEAAGSGPYDPSRSGDPGELPAENQETIQRALNEDGPFFVNEWNCRTQHYHKKWCNIWEKDITPVEDDFIARTMHKYSGLVKHLRRTFEAMRDEDRLLKRQVHGDDVDIDALVQALADAKDGSEMSHQLFTRMHRTERNIAVMFMVDMSGSTKGWINEAIKESLLLLCESLESLGDRYAIYGFSGMKRTRCLVFRIKKFEEKFDETVKGRISGIKPQDYTRMGFAVRYLGQKLMEIDAKKKILIVISDGKPEDWDRYNGEYSIEDTKKSLIEARRNGIHPYCITIDTEAHEYLPHLFGGVNYTFIDDVRKLPLKVSDIYRRLTV